MLRFLLLALLATNVAGQSIYQCRGANGKATLQDRPCPDGAQTELTRKTIGQQNAEYRAQPFVVGEPQSAERLASGIVCPSVRQQYQSAIARSERALLGHDPSEVQRASESVRHAGAQMSKYRCE